MDRYVKKAIVCSLVGAGIGIGSYLSDERNRRSLSKTTKRLYKRSQKAMDNMYDFF